MRSLMALLAIATLAIGVSLIRIPEDVLPGKPPSVPCISGQPHLSRLPQTDSRTVGDHPQLRLPTRRPPKALDVPTLQRNFTHGERAEFHPHGETVCASGCALSRHPTERLTDPQFEQLLADYAVEHTAEPGRALETLLYYGPQTAARLAHFGVGPLDSQHAALLQDELAYEHVDLSLRVVDEAGAVRASLPPTAVPLDRRHEFRLEPHNLQPLIASGTVKRVGHKHLWTRL